MADDNGGNGGNPDGEPTPEMTAETRGKLQSRDAKLRDEEHEKRVRVAELTDVIAERALNADESSEYEELEKRCGEIEEERNQIRSALKVGPFSERINDETGLNEDEKRSFSLRKLIAAQVRNATAQEVEAAAMEREACQARASQIESQPLGFMLPLEVYGDVEAATRASTFARIAGMVNSPIRSMQERGRAILEREGIDQRDLSATDFASAGALVGVDWRPASLIELLRNQQALAQLGPTILSGLVGDVAIPRQTGATEPVWVPKDGGDVGSTDIAVGQVTLTPRAIGAYTDITRQLRLQSSIQVEALLRRDLMAQVALAEDLAALYGSGVNGQPLGIANVTGVGAPANPANAGAPQLNEMMAHRLEVAVDNALRGNLGWASGSKPYTNMMTTVPTGRDDTFIMQELPYPIAETNQIKTNDVFFGNWSDLFIGEWGMLDILVDPYSRSTAGTVRIVIFHSCDVVVRHAESFSRTN